MMQRWTSAFLYEIGVVVFLACVFAVGYSEHSLSTCQLSLHILAAHHR